MGNQQTRKRQATNNDSPVRKKARLSDEHDSSSEFIIGVPVKRKALEVPCAVPKKKRRIKKLSHLLHLGSSFKCEPEDGGSRNRCHSLDRLVSTSTIGTNAASCSSLQRREYPIPWLELLFLPEFPIKSMVSEKSFMIGNELGSGAFGRVFRVTARHDCSGVYAMKVQDKSSILQKEAVQQVKREAAVQRLLSSHVFIARLYATWQTRSKLFSVLQYPVGGLGDLFSVWRDYGNMDETAVRCYAAEIACAVDYIHRCGVIYRDLKLENIVLDSSGHIQVVDFGLAKQLTNGERTNTICGTLQYMSPDVASGEEYGHYVDWWSYAVIIHVLLTGRYPYPNAEAVDHRELRFIDYSTPLGCSDEMGDFFDKLLVVPVRRRLCSYEAIKEHPFLRRINFHDVEDKKLDPIATIPGLGYHLTDDETEDELGEDEEENYKAFDEKYEFNNFDYFHDGY